MIIDIEKFVENERAYWSRLDMMLNSIGERKYIDLRSADKLHYLYERTAGALAQIQTYNNDPEITKYLETLLSRAYRVMNQNNKSGKKFRPFYKLFVEIPQSFRRHFKAMLLATLIMSVGAGFGAVSMHYDYDFAKKATTVFEHLHQSPNERVAKEKKLGNQSSLQDQAAFALHLMINNITVSITALGFGALFGFGTVILLFFNGVILGTVMYDYIAHGEGTFLAGWLLPHGSVEIPAIVIGAGAGFILASAIIGWGNRDPFKLRLKRVMPDIFNMVILLVLLLIWAGLIEAFVSQYHEPQMNVWLKIGFGGLQLLILIAYLAFSGINKKSKFDSNVGDYSDISGQKILDNPKTAGASENK